MLDNFQILTLLNLPGVGRKTVQGLLPLMEHRDFGPREIIKELGARSGRHGDLDALKIQSAAQIAARTIEECHRSGIGVAAWGSPLLPSRIWSIPDAPVLMFYRGNAQALRKEPFVAVVGTRHPTDAGRVAANRLGYVFAKEQCTVVSGLALGCDAAAHEGCLRGGGTAVAVMAHGLDEVHPKANQGLAQAILDHGGCLVSEYPPGVGPRPNLFVERDRLQSGLSAAVAVVETSLEGGTMHTVRFAQAQGRSLACFVPSDESLSAPELSGNRQLLALPTTARLTSQASVIDFSSKLKGKPHPPHERIHPSLASGANARLSDWPQ